MDVDEILMDCEEKMDKALEHLGGELKGIRTGRASPALVEFIKVDYYGSMTDLRQIAGVSVPEPTQLLIKPHDPSSVAAIEKAIQNAGLGLNPMIEAKMIRINLPALSTERRQQLAGSVKQIGEKAKIAIRNVRRDANKHIDQAEKNKNLNVTEDDAKAAKDDVTKETKKHEGKIESLCKEKAIEITTV